MQLKVNAFNNSTGREREILGFFWQMFSVEKISRSMKLVYSILYLNS